MCVVENGVTLDHAAGRWIKAGPVQWMRHRADEFAGGIARQRGIGVQREDVLDRGEDRQVADDLGERFARTAAEQRVELFELAPLALVAHPEMFVRIPHARPVKEMKDRYTCGVVPGIQRLDAFAHQPQQFRVVGLRRIGGVAEVGEECEKQVRVAIPQVPDLQPSTKSVTTCGLVKSVGMTTIVRSVTGIPSEKSSRGNRRGPTRRFTSKFTNVTAICDAPMIPSISNSHNRQSFQPSGKTGSSTRLAVAAVITNSGPR